MRTWFTADTHLGHTRILELGTGRPFGTIEEHDRAYIDAHNDVVGDEDLTWFLGDYALGDRAAGLAKLSQMRGRKRLVIGNHDACFLADPKGPERIGDYLDAGFEAVVPFARVRLPALTKNGPKQAVWLSHFPYDGDSHGPDRHSGARLRDEGQPLVHGHVHDEWTVRASRATGAVQVNVGVDRHGFAPVSAEAVAALIAQGPA